MKSIEKYPLRLQTGSDCRILYGFGEKICQAIDQKLNVQKKTLQNSASMSNFDDRIKPSTAINLSDNDQDESSPPPAKQAKIEQSKRTIKKTTSAGAKLGMIASTQQPTTISTLLGIVDTPMNSSLTPPKSVQTLKPGSFHITLCIDNAEASRSTQKVLLEHLTKNSISFDVRKLNIGDFLWTVRRKGLNSCTSMTLFTFQPRTRTFKSKQFSIILLNVNDWMIYRKVLLMEDIMNKKSVDLNTKKNNDFISTKFFQFRLKQCGITNLIYLVESLKNTNNPGILTPAALNQAIVNTQVLHRVF